MVVIKLIWFDLRGMLWYLPYDHSVKFLLALLAKNIFITHLSKQTVKALQKFFFFIQPVNPLQHYDDFKTKKPNERKKGGTPSKVESRDQLFGMRAPGAHLHVTLRNFLKTSDRCSHLVFSSFWCEIMLQLRTDTSHFIQWETSRDSPTSHSTRAVRLLAPEKVPKIVKCYREITQCQGQAARFQKSKMALDWNYTKWKKIALWR